MQIKTKLDAQQRADQIDAFRAELAILEGEQVLSVDINQRSALTRYHDHGCIRSLWPLSNRLLSANLIVLLCI